MKKIIEVSIGIIFSVLIIISGVMIMVNADKIVSNGDMSPVGSVKSVGYGTMAFGAIALLVSIAGTLHPLGHKLTQTIITTFTMIAAVAFISMYGMSLIVKPVDASGYLTTIPQTTTAGTSVPGGKLPIELLIGILGGSLGAVSIVTFKLFFGGIIVKVSSFSTEEFEKLKIEAEKIEEKFKKISEQFVSLNFKDIENNEQIKVGLSQNLEQNAKSIKAHQEEILQAEKSIHAFNEIIKNAKVEEVVHGKTESKSPNKKAAVLEETKENASDKTDEVKKEAKEKARNETDEVKKQISVAKAKIESDYLIIVKNQNDLVKNVNLVEKEIAKIQDQISKHEDGSKDKESKHEESPKDIDSKHKKNNKEEQNDKTKEKVVAREDGSA